MDYRTKWTTRPHRDWPRSTAGSAGSLADDRGPAAARHSVAPYGILAEAAAGAIVDVMEWNKNGWGPYSKAYTQWTQITAEISSYYSFVLRSVSQAYTEAWAETSAMPNGEGWDQFDHFFPLVDELMPDDFEWTLRANVVRDLVTTLEVYVNHVIDELLLAQGWRLVMKEDKSPQWGTCKKIMSKLFGVELCPEDLEDLRDRRHRLTHQRGVESDGERMTLPPDTVSESHRRLEGHVQRLDEATLPFLLRAATITERPSDISVWGGSWEEIGQP